MKRGLHLISCYLPNNPFVGAFFAALSDELHHHGQDMLLLPTYPPQTDALQYVQIAYTLTGFSDLSAPATGVESGLVPAALADAEAAWTRRRSTPTAHADAVATCTRFFGQLLDQMEPDTVSIWNPTVPQGRLLQMACLARAIPYFGIERGVFAETMMVESREVGAQADVATNPILRSVLASQPVSPARLDDIRHCRVGGGALVRWPPSAAQTARAVFPHAAFTERRHQRRWSEGIRKTSRTSPICP